ncbi:hypothetical protein CLAFUW4_13021 [Fulvia fulva]|uniref:Galactose oxidase n=1 Tax=Passalora fulva TaxID=5499 RepID=A0A9Q8PK61_PASFU|nr:uncharacterized protein CLAFUR5_12882 [Fulvia fulva]KAK4612315.1 hypothetical protein CLAFUR4_13025 [Fulvia fulva]KAK4612822.1 hypothetical protein CLAFUR0_13029 [Fulvia fulva]UJO24021.1 hypothetical protein CLAFUR5_12882 [Fulvia fulva]WPV21087.1 hypothetical protein CLAFUW4_13021 [Fulvia fulva]WPV36341.1 hypothetical protein CLAFUW7_13028 [Fulvia fulva]
MAAEVAAGAWAAEEVVSTGVQAGVGAYMVAKPTMPLEAHFRQIVTTQDDGTRLSLLRSNNSINVVGHRAYIFGGELDGKLAGNEMHSINLQHTEKPEEPESAYSILPAIADEIDGDGLPAPRTKHAASHLNICVAVFGGVDEDGKLVDRDSTLWLYVTAKSAWQRFDAEESGVAPVQRHSAKLFEHNNNLVLYGGIDAEGQELKDVWHFNYSSRKWTPLASAPVSTLNAALVEGTLHLIHSNEPMSSDVHTLNTTNPEKAEWQTHSFPINPLAPGPRPRVGGGLVPVSTGYGRNYLLYFFGARQNPSTHETKSPNETEDPTQWSDLWTYQVGSSKPEAKVTTSLADAIKPAAIKDAIRSKLGYDTGSHSWAEVEVQPPEDLPEGEGKVHPGPRAYFGYDVTGDGHQVVMWGGMNAKGEREGDGWLITFS